jgi:hypothetical protein
MLDYPEHAKLAKVKDQSQAIHEFIEFLRDDKHIFLCDWYDGEDTADEEAAPGCYLQIRKRLTTLVAEFLGVDENKLELEKQKMLAELRRQNGNA